MLTGISSESHHGFLSPVFHPSVLSAQRLYVLNPTGLLGRKSRPNPPLDFSKNEKMTSLACFWNQRVCSAPQESDKCFECNSQVPGEPGRGRSSHRIENVIYLTDSSGEETWWQSVNGAPASTRRGDGRVEETGLMLISSPPQDRRTSASGSTWRLSSTSHISS